VGEGREAKENNNRLKNQHEAAITKKTREHGKKSERITKKGETRQAPQE
jgi:hypothetical protein